MSYSRKPTYFHVRHTETGGGSGVAASGHEITVQLPLDGSANAKPAKQLWLLCGFTIVSDAQSGTNATSCTIRFANSSGWTNDEQIAQFHRQSASFISDWATSTFMNDPTIFIPDSNGRLYVDFTFSHGSAHKFTLDLVFQKLEGGTAATTA
jgi:hypothetical protein